MTCVLIDKHAPHREDCSWWHGGTCDCHPAMQASAAVDKHCRECDYVNSYTGSTPCNCGGSCLFPAEAHDCELNGLTEHTEGPLAKLRRYERLTEKYKSYYD